MVGPNLGDIHRAKIVSVSSPLLPNEIVLVQYVPGGYACVPRKALIAGWPPKPANPFIVKVQTIEGTWAPLNGEHREYTADDAFEAALLYLKRNPDVTAARIYNVRHLDDQASLAVTRDVLDSIVPQGGA